MIGGRIDAHPHNKLTIMQNIVVIPVNLQIFSISTIIFVIIEHCYIILATML